MIWSDKTKEAVASLFQDCRHKYIQSGLRFVKPLQTDYEEAKAALAAVAESDEWKAKDQEIAEQCRIIGASGSRELKLLGEIERLKRQVSVLREVKIPSGKSYDDGYLEATRETLQAADAKYLGVIEKLEAKVKRLNAIIDEVKVFMHVSHTLSGFHDSKPKILEMVEFEEKLDELQALAAADKIGEE